MAKGIEAMKRDKSEPTALFEFQEVFEKRGGIIMGFAVCPFFWILCGPFTSFPVLVGLLIKPVGLALQVAGWLGEDEPLGSDTPAWVNDCLSAQNQITNVSTVDGQFDVYVKKMRAFAVIGTLFIIFAVFSMGFAYVACF